MKTPNQHLKKTLMWYKVNELKSKGLNISQISVSLGLDRSTVRKYLSLDESSFLSWISEIRHRPKKLQLYYEYVKTSLESHPYLSASQVEDWLKEHYKDLPEVHSKTVYNFVKQIREEHHIPKKEPKSPRQYEHLPQTDYGDQAQVDFGSFHMPDSNGNRRKVYFFVMILSRSRYKYVYFQSKPFNTRSTIDAHERAFEYFQGQPHNIIYDQDRVLMVNENMGDLILTQEFQQYLSSMTFTAVFCRKSDPESKGKVENVVGFVKKNFLPGRTYSNDQSLNESCLDWLWRTGNGRVHGGIQKIPYQEWLIERKKLHPYYKQPGFTPSLLPYKVRKDNTISYKGNFYTLPLNTYQGSDTTVLLKTDTEKLYLYDKENKLLTTHVLCNERGQTVRNTDHRRDKSQSLEVLKAEVSELFKSVPLYEVFIEQLSVRKQRYLRDNLLLLKHKSPDVEHSFLKQAISFCVENALFNANTVIQTALHYQKESSAQQQVVLPQIEIKSTQRIQVDYHPQTSQINTYQKIMQ